MGFIGETGNHLLRNEAVAVAPLPFSDVSFPPFLEGGGVLQGYERVDIHSLVMQLQEADELVNARVTMLPPRTKLDVMEALSQAKEEGKLQEETSLGTHSDVVTAFSTAWPMVEKDMIVMVKQKEELPEDTQIASVVVNEAQRSMALIAERYYADIGKYFLRRVGNEERAHDLTQDLFRKVWEKIGKYQDKGLPFSAWVYRMAHNHLIDEIRGNKKRNGDVSLDNAPEISHDTSGITHAEDRAVLGPALARLTAEQRQTVELRFLEGCTTAETAARMGKTEEAVKKLQARGLANLRRLLGGRKAMSEGKKGVVFAALLPTRVPERLSVVPSIKMVGAEEYVKTGAYTARTRRKVEKPTKQLSEGQLSTLGGITRILDQNPQLRIIQTTSEKSALHDPAVKEALQKRNITVVFERLERQ